MKTFERRHSSVDFDDDLQLLNIRASKSQTMSYLVCHLDELWRCSHRRTWDDAALFGDGGSFDDDNVKLVVRLVLGVKALLLLGTVENMIKTWG